MSKIKICGLTRLEDIAAVNEAFPDYIGFVFAKSRRQISKATAARMKQQLHPEIKAVGVFVNEDMDLIADLCNHGIIDLIQLHGDEDQDYLTKLRSLVPNKIIKAVRMQSPEVLEKAIALGSDYLLLDAFHPRQYGGSGEVFDWSMAKGLTQPYFLAGGLNYNNVLQAIHTLQPYCVDLSSGVETDGRKDPEKIKEIVRRIRSID
jgi:phosphoribosylanthranilate isomerase